jgi:acetyl-CoA C-acetyltransferase
MSNTEVVIVAAYRTPIGNIIKIDFYSTQLCVIIIALISQNKGSFNGSLSSFRAHELGCLVLKQILAETETKPDEVIIGQALTAGAGQNPARQTSIAAGLPNSIPATTVNMLCGSGLRACALGYQSIRSGDASVVVCGGQESMSNAPHCLHLRNGHKMNDVNMVDTMIKDGLTDAFNNVHMGITAENVAKGYKVSREDQDKFAVASQQKYKLAHQSGIFKNEIGLLFFSKLR